MEHSGDDLQLFIDRTFRVSMSSSSALRKLINAFLFSFGSVGDGALQVD